MSSFGEGGDTLTPCTYPFPQVGVLEETLYAGDDKQHKAWVKLHSKKASGLVCKWKALVGERGRKGQGLGEAAVQEGELLRSLAKRRRRWRVGRRRWQHAAPRGRPALPSLPGPHPQPSRARRRACAASCTRGRCCTARRRPTAAGAAGTSAPRASLRTTGQQDWCGGRVGGSGSLGRVGGWYVGVGRVGG